MEGSFSWSLLGHYSSTYALQIFFRSSQKNCKGVLPNSKLIDSMLQHPPPPCSGERNLNLKISSLSGGIQVFYLEIWRCFKVMSSLSPANGSEENVYKVHALNVGQYVESHGR